jgi:hypothetical protein
MSKEKGEVPITTDMIDRSFEEREGGPTSIDVTANQNSIGEVSHVEPQGVLEQNSALAHLHEEPSISRRKQKRRITSYLSNISKQVEKHGNQINKMTLMIQSLQKQKQTVGVGIDQIQFKSIKQIRSQIDQLQKQVSRIQNDIRRIRTASMTRTRTRTKFRKQAPSTIATVKSRSKRNKLIKSTKVKKRRK